MRKEMRDMILNKFRGAYGSDVDELIFGSEEDVIYSER